jgi:hypothetical protein
MADIFSAKHYFIKINNDDLCLGHIYTHYEGDFYDGNTIHIHDELMNGYEMIDISKLREITQDQYIWAYSADIDLMNEIITGLLDIYINKTEVFL